MLSSDLLGGNTDQVKDPYFTFQYRPLLLPTINGVKPPSLKSVLDCTLGFRRFESSVIYANSSKDYFPSTFDSEGPVIMFEEDSELSATKWVNAWQDYICDEEGLYEVPDNFKKDLEFEMYDVKGKTIGTHKSSGCWPLGVASYNLSKKQSDILIVEVSFACDLAKLKK